MKKLIVMLLVTFSVVTAGAWVIEIVDECHYPDDQYANSSCIAIDSSNQPNILYSSAPNINELRYARMIGTIWSIEVIDTCRSYHQLSLALDSSDYPHVVYNSLVYDLMYGYWDGTAWQIETVNSEGRKPSMTLDSSDKPHISYLDSTSNDLKYASWDGSAWQIETVDSEIIVSGSVSLALDSSDKPHISYLDSISNDLKYASWDGSAWQIETVDSEEYVDRTPSLALDSSDNPHISYYVDTNDCLKHAYWDGSAWQIEVVDYSYYATNSTLRVDCYSRPHIAYWKYDGYETNLMHAHHDGASWQFEEVDSDGAGNQFGLTFDSSNNPHLSYQHGYQHNLTHAYWDPDASGVDDLSLAAEVADDGVLLSWSIVGDEPVSVSVLRAVSSNALTQNDTLTQNGSVDISGELSGSATSWLDVSAEAGVEYAYYLEVTELDGTVSRFGPSEVIVQGMVSELTLSDPYPNPADENLTIHYELTQNATVKLHIYDVAGRLVETLISGEQTAGRHSVSWDSSVAATGVYLLRLEAEGNAITRRAVISR